MKHMRIFEKILHLKLAIIANFPLKSRNEKQRSLDQLRCSANSYPRDNYSLSAQSLNGSFIGMLST